MTVAGAIGVHADDWPEAQCQLAHEVIDRGLADVVRLAAGLRHQRVRRAGQHDGGRQALRREHFRGLLREHVVRRDVDLQCSRPDVFGRGRRIRSRVDGRGVDHDVDAAELPDRFSQRRSDRLPPGQVERRRVDHLRVREFCGVPGGLFRPCRIRVGDHDVAAAPGNLQRDLASDTAAAADDHGDSATQLPLRRHALELRLFERPVLDPESLQPRQRDIVA